MKAPDKIFVSSDPFGFMSAYDMENHPPHGEEYIRKDALLEWVRLAYGKLSMNSFDVQDVFEELIDKIK